MKRNIGFIAAWAVACWCTNASAQVWRTIENVDKLDGSKEIAVILNTNATEVSPQRRPVKSGVASAVRIDCVRGKTNFYFLVPDTLISGHTARVSYRIDDKLPVRRARWSSSTDSSAAGHWGSKSAVQMAKALLPAKTLFIRVEDDTFGATEATFQTAGLEEAIKPLRQECKW